MLSTSLQKITCLTVNLKETNRNLQQRKSRETINEERRIKKSRNQTKGMKLSQFKCVHMKFPLVYRFLHTKTKLCLTFSRLRFTKAEFHVHTSSDANNQHQRVENIIFRDFYSFFTASDSKRLT